MEKIAAKVLALCLLLTLTVEANSIQWKIDESGRRVYYNIPSTLPSDNPLGIYYSQKAANYINLIQQICARHSVDAELVKAVIQVESNYEPRAVSRKGAMGLMQLMPGTAARYGVRQIFDPSDNIEGGVKYLRDLLQLFGSDLQLALAAYNAGETVVQRVNGIPNYVETKNYVRKVLALYNGEASYTPYASGKPRMVTYFKYVDERGITPYTAEQPPGIQSTKVSFYY